MRRLLFLILTMIAVVGGCAAHEPLSAPLVEKGRVRNLISDLKAPGLKEASRASKANLNE